MNKILIVVPPTERDGHKIIGFKDFYKDAVKNGMLPVNDLSDPIGQLTGLASEHFGLLNDLDAVWYSTVYGVDKRMSEILTTAKQIGITVVKRWDLDITKAFADAYNFVADNHSIPEKNDMDAYWDKVAKHLND